MEIFLTNKHNPILRNVDDFTSFHIDATNLGEDEAAVATAIGHGAEADGEGHIWVSADHVRDLAGRHSDPQWQRSFTKMLEAVRPYGWCSEDLARIRAHVKRS